MLDIEGASAVVTGGASGLGAATARLLAERGAKVAVVDLNEHLGGSVAAEIRGWFAKADVADERQVQAAIDAASQMGPLRVLVNCAGIGNAGRTVDRNGSPFDLKTFELVVRVNLIGSFNCLRLAAAAMSRTEPLAGGERGAIVNTSSVAAFDGQIGQVAYSASKGGVVGMTLPVARDLAAIGVRVNTIAPGLIDTPIYGEGAASEAFKENLGRNVLFPRRLGTSEEFASLVLEVVTNSYINGETIRIDGGIRMPPK
jgi:NAD(P)-dependent dehydrogenase (short-subunit alcohol dehydrogenase family)